MKSMNFAPDTLEGIAFGRFRVLPHRRELLADDEPIKLGGRAFDLLMALIEAPGAVVSKDDLVARVWPGRVVTETNLQTQILALRRAFGADRDLIRTVSGRGYQFTGEIRMIPAGPGQSVVAVAPSAAAMRRQSDKPAAAGFRTDRPRGRGRGGLEPGSRRPARHPDRRRGHRQDAARPRGRAAGCCRNFPMAYGWPNFRRSPIPAWFPRPSPLRSGSSSRRRDFGAARGAGARGAAPVAGAGHLRACDRRRGGDGRGCAAGRIGGSYHRHQPRAASGGGGAALPGAAARRAGRRCARRPSRIWRRQIVRRAGARGRAGPGRRTG